ncbi:MAG: hypothetical protein MJ132_01825 [Clostridia bacterium]|nr:hypothetical protein [Clostridia bacterium]
MKYNDFMTDTMSNEQAIASLEEMKKDENLATVIEQQLVSYALFQKEGLSYDASKLSGLEKYERYDMEYTLVRAAVKDFLTTKAVKK